jgi:hypothetical protein
MSSSRSISSAQAFLLLAMIMASSSDKNIYVGDAVNRTAVFVLEKVHLNVLYYYSHVSVTF